MTNRLLKRKIAPANHQMFDLENNLFFLKYPVLYIVKAYTRVINKLPENQQNIGALDG